MKRMVSRTAVAAGSLALVGGAVVAGAAPAGAVPIGNEAYGAATSGTVAVPPVANATVADSPLVASNANVPGVLSTGNIFDRADPNGASSRVTQGVVINLPDGGQLQASQVSSWCRIVGGDVYGGVTITAGRVIGNNNVNMSFPLPMHPAADDVITLPNGAGTITLNDQTSVVGENGYAAIDADLTGGQHVVLAVSACYVAPVG